MSLDDPRSFSPFSFLAFSVPFFPIIMTLQKDDDPSRGFWVEGRIYAVSARKEDKDRGWRECEYNAVKVLWYEQDLAMPDRWAIEIYQTSNTLSPWVRTGIARA